MSLPKFWSAHALRRGFVPVPSSLSSSGGSGWIARLMLGLTLWGLGSLGEGRAYLLLSSMNGHRVQRYNETNGAFISAFVTPGSGGLTLPHGLAIGPDGNLYVASAGNDAVLRYNGTNGTFLGEFVASGVGGLDYPVWIEFRPDGHLYVSSQLSHSVLRYDAIRGTFAGAFVTNGSGGLNGPSGMTWGPDGHLYVVGRFGNQLLKYDGTNGAFLGTVSAAGGPLNQPFGIVVGPDDHLYVVSGNDNSIARFDGQTGAFLGTFPTGTGGGLSLPVGLAFGPDGNLYVASFSNSKVARFNGGTGAYLNDFVTAGSGGLNGPNFMLFRPARTYGTNIPGIGPVGPIEQRHFGRQFTEGPAADANGHLYFSDVQANTIYRSDTRGLLSVFYPNSSACNGLMFDRRGRLVACQRTLQRIIAIHPITRAVTPLATQWNGRAFIGPNDLVIDSAGGVYFSDPSFASGQTGPTQSVYYVSAAGAVSQVISNHARPNGVILAPDESKLYVVLSGAATLYTYPVAGPGQLGTPTTTPLPASGDGMTIDTQGNLYLCQPSQNRILVLAPGGMPLGSIPFPEAPANCAFGGQDMKTLFVTARTSLYACRMTATGHRFAANPASYEEFQEKFFGTSATPIASPAQDPDADGAVNQLEYLTRTHPLLGGDAFGLSLGLTGVQATLSFPYVSGRGYIIEFQDALAPAAGWVRWTNHWPKPPPSPLMQRALVPDDLQPETNRFYRVRVEEASGRANRPR